MSQQSAFDRQHIVEKAVDIPPGLLEQLNLPPRVIAFIRKNQRSIWIAAGCIALAVIAVNAYSYYTNLRDEKAASALTAAMEEEGTKKQELLVQVVDEYGSTPSALWGRIELAHLAVERGELDKAIQQFSDVKSTVRAKNPVMPLVLYALGALYEKTNELDKAAASFNELSAFKGFESSSYEALGRVYEAQGKTANALEMYRKAIGTDAGGEGEPSASPGRETIQARINALQD